MTSIETIAAASAEPGGDSFAQYLAKYFIAKKGYQEGAVPEAAPLAAASDYILSKYDGMILSIVCIVDATRNALRHFALDREAVIAAAKACRAKHGMRMSWRRMPVLVEIVEVRDQVLPRDVARLKPMRARYGQMVATYAVDLKRGTVTSNWRALYNARQKQIEAALRAPRLSAAALTPPPQAATADISRRPILTVAMLAVLAAIFAAEARFPAEGGPVNAAPSLETLIAFGGLMRSLVVERGEWFRLFTAPLLHASIEHILFNAIAFWFAGSVLEKLLGRAWLLALFFLGGLGGAMMSLVINPPNIVSVGASGAIMCMIAAAFMVSFRFPGSSRHQVQFRMLRMLIPSLLPLAIQSQGDGVDYGAHFGGAITGFLVSGILLWAWPRAAAAPAPRLAPVAKIVAALGLLVFSAAGYQAYAGYETYALSAYLIPDADLPQSDAEIASKSKALLAAYPRDPRAHFYRAVAVMDQDAPAAERELRAALAQKDMLEIEFKPEFKVTLTAYLAQTLISQGRADEARLEAKPFCHTGKDGGVPEDLQSLAVCPAP